MVVWRTYSLVDRGMCLPSNSDTVDFQVDDDAEGGIKASQLRAATRLFRTWACTAETMVDAVISCRVPWHLNRNMELYVDIQSDKMNRGRTTNSSA